MNKCCTELTCAQLTYNSLDEIIYQSKLQLCEYMDAYISESEYGYSCIDDPWVKYDRLRSDLQALEQYRFQSYYGAEPCLCPEEVQTIAERVLDIVGSCSDGVRYDMKLDDSNIIDWRINNPYCISRQAWEDALYVKCDPLSFNIKVIKKIAKCEIDFKLTTLINAIGSCEIRYKVNREEVPDCTIEYNILKKELPDCTITFDTYRELRDCGIDYKLIIDVADCDITFDIDKETRCPAIIYNLNSFPVCDWPDIELDAVLPE